MGDKLVAVTAADIHVFAVSFVEVRDLKVTADVLHFTVTEEGFLYLTVTGEGVIDFTVVSE